MFHIWERVNVISVVRAIKHLQVYYIVGIQRPYTNRLAKVQLILQYKQVNQKLLYRESDWWDVGLVVQKARKQGTVY